MDWGTVGKVIVVIAVMYALLKVGQYVEAMNDKLDEIIELLNDMKE